MKYAKTTEVSADKSRAEIERTLSRYGATEFLYGTKAGMALVVFSANSRRVKFILPLPSKSEFLKTDTGCKRSSSQQEAEFARAIRQRWRALALYIKAKLELCRLAGSQSRWDFHGNI